MPRIINLLIKYMKYLGLLIVFAFIFAPAMMQAQNAVPRPERTEAMPPNVRARSIAPMPPKTAEEKLRIRKEEQEKMEALKERRAENREETKEKRAENKEEIREEMKEKRTELRDEMQEVRAERIKKARVLVATGFFQRVGNLSQIAERIETRIEKLQTAGVDTAMAEELLAKARTSLSEAKSAADSLKPLAESDGTLEEIKNQINAVKTSLKEAGGYLSQAVQNLKAKTEAKTEVEVDADTTTP